MDIKTVALYLPLFNAVLYGLYYALLQESYRALSLSTIMFANGALYILLALVASFFRFGELSIAPLKDSKLLIIFIAVLIVATVSQATHYISLKNTSATYMAFAELSYPLFVPLFTYYLFSRSEMTPSIGVGGGLILLGSYIITRGGAQP